MIIDPKTLEAEPQDAPPAYEPASSSSASSSTPRPEKQPESPALTSPTSPISPSSASLKTGHRSKSSGWLWSTLGLGMGTQADRDVKATVLGLVRDLLKASPSSAPDAIAILQSCAEACRARGLSLETILQEQFVESHTPLYWAILKNKSTEGDNQINLVDLLMSFPLTPATIADARQACLLNSDDPLFQRLRKSPGCAGVNAKDELLLGEAPQDWVLVQNAPGDHGAFKVMLHFVHFQQRMRVSRSVRAEFIARGRIWFISFYISNHQERNSYREGTWLVAVGLADNSPSTHLDSRLVIQPRFVSASSQSEPEPQMPGTTMVGWANRIAGNSSSKSAARPPISVRLRSSHSTQVGERDYSDATRQKRAVAALADSAGGAALEFDGCPHINSDGSLDAVFEAELAQGAVDSDCIIS